MSQAVQGCNLPRIIVVFKEKWRMERWEGLRNGNSFVILKWMKTKKIGGKQMTPKQPSFVRKEKTKTERKKKKRNSQVSPSFLIISLATRSPSSNKWRRERERKNTATLKTIIFTKRGATKRRKK